MCSLTVTSAFFPYLLKAQEDAKLARATSGGGKKSKQASTPTIFKPLHAQVCPPANCAYNSS
jgi:hypothetical protein